MMRPKPMLILLHCLLSVSIASSPASGRLVPAERKITLKLEAEPLRRALDLISQKGGVYFIFEDRLVENRTVTCDIEDLTLHEALSEILEDTGIVSRIVQTNRIALFRKDAPRLSSTLRGSVKDVETGEPIHYANVFLSNTSLGCATDPDGSFSIENVPAGTYELIVSMMGYTLESRTVDCSGPSVENQTIRITPSPVQGEAVRVTAPTPREWQKRVRTFEEQFIGTTENAKRCEILNPEVLDFEYDRKLKVLSASARAPLSIENRALGYRIEFYLSLFTYQAGEEVKYYGKTRFIPMESRDSREIDRWRKNRLAAYFGSELHFLRAAYENRLGEEGFVARHVTSMVGDVSANNLRDFDPSVSFVICDLLYRKKLSFPKFIRVEFAGGELVEEVWFVSVHPNLGRTAVKKLSYPVSWLKLNTETVTINSSGFVETPFGVKTYGEWATKRVGDKLPNDYWPE